MRPKKENILTTDDITMMRGTYFNPVNEVIVVVDDENYLEMSEVDLTDLDGGDWFMVSEDPLVDKTAVEEILQVWQTKGGVETTNELSQTAKDQQD